LENIKLNNEIDSLKIKFDKLEHYNLRHSIEIKGITKTLNENYSDIFHYFKLLPKKSIVMLLLIQHTDLPQRKVSQEF
jgi:hypothetical protein